MNDERKHHLSRGRNHLHDADDALENAIREFKRHLSEFSDDIHVVAVLDQLSRLRPIFMQANFDLSKSVPCLTS